MPKIVKVKFANGDSPMPASPSEEKLYHRTYDYFLVHDDIAIPRDGFAVVEVSGILKIVRIVGQSTISAKATKYVITVFSLEEHKRATEKAQSITEVREAILKRAEEAAQRQKFASLAEHDPVLKAMLDDLTRLESE